MATLTIDTHKAVTLLKQHGYSEQQAEGMVAVFKDAELNEVASKQDVRQVAAKIDVLRGDMYKALMVQTLVIVAAIVGILQLVL